MNIACAITSTTTNAEPPTISEKRLPGLITTLDRKASYLATSYFFLSWHTNDVLLTGWRGKEWTWSAYNTTISVVQQCSPQVKNRIFLPFFFGILMFVYLFKDTKGAYSHFVYERSFGIPITLFVPDALLSHIKITLNRRTLRFFFIWKPLFAFCILHFLIHGFKKMFFILIIFIIYYPSIILIILIYVKQSLYIWFLCPNAVRILIHQ